jgi:glycosyltransferase involved in cell wall biosynthesis
MRILRISSYFAAAAPPRPFGAQAQLMRKFRAVGGQQIQVRLLTSTLAALGVQQEVITARPPWCPAAEERDGVRIYRHGLPVRMRHQLYQLPALVHAVRRAPDGFDLVHVHSGEDVSAIPIGIAAARLAGIPLVITLHNSWNLTYKRVALRPWQMLRQRLGRQAEIAGLDRASAICILTERTAQLLEAKLSVPASKLFVIPDSVDLSRFEIQPSPAETAEFSARHRLPRGMPCILFLGRLTAQKGVTHLLHAAALLKGRGQRFLLIICGDGIQRAQLEREARAVGVYEDTIFTGFIKNEEVPLALAIADLAVLPSVYEEFGSVLLEVMASGTPIVATSVGGIPATIRHMHNGMLVPPENANELASAMARLLRDQSLAQALAARAVVVAHEHEALAVGRRMIAVYASCMTQPAEYCKGVDAI